MKVKFKIIHPDAKLPSYARPGDAGLDVVATSIIEENNLYVEYGTGLSYELPSGYVALAFPRSSLSKYTLALANSVGVLDAGYRGEVKFRFRKLENSPINARHYQIGDKIGQLVIVPHPVIEPVEAEELASSERGENGYGSTGK